MGRKEVAAERARIATQISLLMAQRSFYSDLIAKDALDTDGTIPLIVASEDESAVVAMHRFDRTGLEKVILATNVGDSAIQIVGLRKREDEDSPPESPPIDIVGGVTVRQWITLMQEDPGRGYTMTGSDVMPFAESSLYATASAAGQGDTY